MQAQNRHGFVSGMLLGVVISLVVGLIGVYLLVVLDVVSVSVVDRPGFQALSDWMRRNLGLSVLPFTVTLGLYFHALRALARRLDQRSPQNEVAQLEHLTDVWTSLFFGIGVIWTAIGMRGALLYAIGDPAVAAESGAFAILTRLVDGGILTALTTTIVGGVGGYLMRVVKSSWLGTRLSRYYEEQEQRHAAQVETLLREIRESIGAIGPGGSPAAYELIEEK
ncbi:MAG: hypothetical protein PVI91_07615 [Gammaproteobacteria bacterium]|jgi:hypothetical protein